MNYRGPFIYVPTHQNTTAGGPVDVDYQTYANPSAFDQLAGNVNFQSQVIIVASPPVEGIQYPFLSRFTEGSPYPRNSIKAVQDSFYTVANNFQYYAGTPKAILNAPPDTTEVVPVINTQIYPLVHYQVLSNTILGMAANTKTYSPGANPFVIPAASYTVPVCQLLSEIQQHLLETVNGGASFSTLWTVSEILTYLNNRISRFMLETACLQQTTSIPATAGIDIYDLPADLIDLRTVVWTSGSTTTVLPRADSYQADLYYTSWDSVGGTPTVYMMVPEQSLEIRLAPQPSTNGTIGLIYVPNRPTVTNDCSIMPVPDEWTPFIKWGVLADCLAKEGEANNLLLAKYCEQRYKDGVQLANLYLGVSQ